MIDHSEYSLETIRNDGEFILYRGRRQTDATPSSILALTPVSERPPLESLRRMEHEYSLRAELDPGMGRQASRPRAVHKGGRCSCSPTPGASRSIDSSDGRWKLAQFLRVAIGSVGRARPVPRSAA